MTTNGKTVYLVRHGQSEGNVTDSFQPLDSPLTEAGKRQAIEIANRIQKIDFETLIVSPLLRTKETAKPIIQVTGKEPVYSDLFVERVKPTSIVGKPYSDEVASATWNEWEQSLYTPGKRVEDGENFDDLIARADEALQFLYGRPEKSLVVVTHGYFLRVMTIRVLLADALTPAAYRNFQARTGMENTGITVFTYSRNWEDRMTWRLKTFNDHAHLG